MDLRTHKFNRFTLGITGDAAVYGGERKEGGTSGTGGTVSSVMSLASQCFTVMIMPAKGGHTRYKCCGDMAVSMFNRLIKTWSYAICFSFMVRLFECTVSPLWSYLSTLLCYFTSGRANSRLGPDISTNCGSQTCWLMSLLTVTDTK